MKHEDAKAIHIWLPKETIKHLGYLAVDWEMSRTEVARILLAEALEHHTNLKEVVPRE